MTLRVMIGNIDRDGIAGKLGGNRQIENELSTQHFLRPQTILLHNFLKSAVSDITLLATRSD